MFLDPSYGDEVCELVSHGPPTQPTALDVDGPFGHEEPWLTVAMEIVVLIEVKMRGAF
ncbi:MAG: hypothetical protein OK454_12400 [Thaumarchaeota archaeon]|nr:hypothetical protein [Nitrososphaerota archaeon]